MTLASSILLASLPVLINLYATRFREQDKLEAFPNNPDDFNLPIEEKFDFIVVGGGAAGCVVARRLADENFTVLLLEAGGNPPPLQAVPMMSALTKFFPEINFLFQSIPQKHAALAKNGILRTPAGKMLGGSTSHNDMMYERGHPQDYNEWAAITGDPSWEYGNVLQYFIKSENYMGNFQTEKGQHGYAGPFTVSQPKYAPGREVWLEAGTERGFQVGDPNGPQSVGFSPNEFAHKFGRRVSTYKAFIEPIEKQHQFLTVRRYSLVSQVLIDNQKRAFGVKYDRHGVPRVATATKEVILSAGAYMSPLILIKSGIGPLDQLAAAQVEPVAVLPVGENLMDHPLLEVAPILIDPSYAWNLENNLTFQDFSTFIERGEGPLTTSFEVGQSEAFIASSRAVVLENKPNWPDLQIYYEYLGTVKDSVTCYIGVNRPYSRGRITLNSSAVDMEDSLHPIIDYNYFGVESDFDIALDGINFCLDTIEKTNAFAKTGAKFTTESIPQCKDLPFRSRDYWICYIRHKIDSTYHASGTCRMGKITDPNSVVDSSLRVIGVTGLRIADASIMPRITNANLAAPTIMIGEKVAALLIDEQNRNKVRGRGTDKELNVRQKSRHLLSGTYSQPEW